MFTAAYFNMATSLKLHSRVAAPLTLLLKGALTCSSAAPAPLERHTQLQERRSRSS